MQSAITFYKRSKHALFHLQCLTVPSVFITEPSWGQGNKHFKNSSVQTIEQKPQKPSKKDKKTTYLNPSLIKRLELHVRMSSKCSKHNHNVKDTV